MALLTVINPSCFFKSCENVKGETPPPVTNPKLCEAQLQGRHPLAAGSGPHTTTHSGGAPAGQAAVGEALGAGSHGKLGDFLGLLPWAGVGPISMPQQGSAGSGLLWLAELAPEISSKTTWFQMPQAYPAHQGFCLLLSFPLAHQLSCRPEVSHVLTGQPPTCLLYLPNAKTKPCGGGQTAEIQ